MKYFILVNQQVLAKTNLDIVDGAILDYIYFYCNSQNEKVKSQRIIDKNETWTWIDYQSFLKDMPMLKIRDKGALSRRIDKIENSGYIKTKRFQHTKKYFRMTAKSDELFIQMNRAIDTKQQGCCSKTTGAVDIKQPIKIKDNKDKKINNIVSKADGKKINFLIEKFKSINPSYERLFANKSQRSALERMIKKFGFSKMERIIDALPEITCQKFAPRITTPITLENKLGDLIIFVEQQKGGGTIKI